MDKRHTIVSKFLSYVLRHRPDEVGIAPDRAGWVGIDDLIAAAAASGQPVTRAEIEHVVAHNDKRRFAVSSDGLRIRASHGHSIEVDLGYEPTAPPETLYHGTTTADLAGILAHGLVKGKRHYVHLSDDDVTARTVGQRHGHPVVLKVRAGDMYRAGFAFFHAPNGVWLTDHVPRAFVDETDAT